MFDISFAEMMVVAVVALIVIGPEKLPKVARTLGHLLGRAQRYINGVKADMARDMNMDELNQLQEKIKQEFNQAQETVRQTSLAIDKQVQQINGTVAQVAQQALPPGADSGANSGEIKDADEAGNTEASPEPPSPEPQSPEPHSQNARASRQVAIPKDINKNIQAHENILAESERSHPVNAYNAIVDSVRARGVVLEEDGAFQNLSTTDKEAARALYALEEQAYLLRQHGTASQVQVIEPGRKASGTMVQAGAHERPTQKKSL